MIILETGVNNWLSVSVGIVGVFCTACTGIVGMCVSYRGTKLQLKQARDQQIRQIKLDRLDKVMDDIANYRKLCVIIAGKSTRYKSLDSKKSEDRINSEISACNEKINYLSASIGLKILNIGGDDENRKLRNAISDLAEDLIKYPNEISDRVEDYDDIVHSYFRKYVKEILDS